MAFESENVTKIGCGVAIGCTDLLLAYRREVLNFLLNSDHSLFRDGIPSLRHALCYFIALEESMITKLPAIEYCINIADEACVG